MMSAAYDTIVKTYRGTAYVAIAYLPLILGRVTRRLKAIFQYNQRQGSLVEEPL